MDISMRTSGGDFNLRAAAVIIRDGKLLVAKHDDYDCFYTPGGHVRENESTEDAVLREAREETGLEFSAKRLAYVQERFYSTDIRHHEVIFYYLLEPVGMSMEGLDIRDGVRTDLGVERLYWLPIGGAGWEKLVPEALRGMLREVPEVVEHVVSVGG